MVDHRQPVSGNFPLMSVMCAVILRIIRTKEIPRKKKHTQLVEDERSLELFLVSKRASLKPRLPNIMTEKFP